MDVSLGGNGGAAGAEAAGRVGVGVGDLGGAEVLSEHFGEVAMGHTAGWAVGGNGGEEGGAKAADVQ